MGDEFMFFGLFADEHTAERHHRLFGYLLVEAVHPIATAAPEVVRELAALRHPHALGHHAANNTVYRGRGGTALRAADSLRLTKKNAPLSRWIVPSWLRGFGLTYHGDARRWIKPDELQVVARGQEFVCDIGDDPQPRQWLDDTIGTMS